MTHDEVLEWLRERVAATVGTEFKLTHDACAQAIHAIEPLAKVREAWERYQQSGKLGYLTQGVGAALEDAKS